MLAVDVNKQKPFRPPFLSKNLCLTPESGPTFTPASPSWTFPQKQVASSYQGTHFIIEYPQISKMKTSHFREVL